MARIAATSRDDRSRLEPPSVPFCGAARCPLRGWRSPVAGAGRPSWSLGVAGCRVSAVQVQGLIVPLYVQTRARLALALCTPGYAVSRRCPPVAAYRLDCLATVGELLEAPEDPSPAHSGNRDEFAYGDSLRGRGGKRGPEYGIRICALLGYVFNVDRTGVRLVGVCLLGCRT